MFVYLLISIINLLYWALFILFIARMILSFVHIDPYDPTWGFIPRKLTPLVYQLTEPILRPVRNIIPPQGGLDFSPLIVLIGFAVLRSIIFGMLF
jgi:YggT family protein